ncbi:hypothetical protein A5662_12210 [Mycobacteriaceae bacterium 1482268.1]|nr:hypothetical protein A5662_12210 [Mycobacteriaceae bacterium 1482268.1]
MMADWGAIAGIGATAAVAISGQVFGWLGRRGDREHESALEYEKRAWEKKNPALENLIRDVSLLRRSTEPNNDWTPQGITANRQLARRRVAALQTYDEFLRSRLDTTAVLAYASPSVRKLVQQLDDTLRAQFATATLINLNNLRKRAQEKEEAIDAGNFDEAASLRQAEVVHAETIGTDVTLDVDGVQRLCDQILDAARNDLRGK